jgi:branched-chain amino acid transport system substrate-binding protein
MKRKLIGIGAIVLVLALLLTLAPACGNGDEEATPTPTMGPGATPTPGATATATPDVKTIKWGIITPYSGPGAFWGANLDEGFVFAVDKINREGGIKVGDDTYMVKVVKCDNKLSGSASATCASQMVFDENVHYTFGMFLATVIDAARPILNDGKCFISGVEADFVSPEYPYYWANLQPQFQYVRGWYEQLYDYMPDIETVAFLTTNSPTDTYVYETARASMEELFGAEVVHVSTFEAGTTDFYPMLTQIAAKNPDAVGLAGGPSGTQALIIKQLRELGWEGQFCGSNAGDPGAFVEIAGKEAVEGFLTNEPDYSRADLWPAETVAIYAEFQSLKPGAQFGLSQYLGYGSAMFYKQVIEAAGSVDSEEVLKVLDDPNFEYEWFGVSGRKLGGQETFGLRRVHQDFVSFTVVRDGEKVQLSFKGSVVP